MQEAKRFVQSTKEKDRRVRMVIKSFTLQALGFQRNRELFEGLTGIEQNKTIYFENAIGRQI
jgi:hypothetical protein